MSLAGALIAAAHFLASLVMCLNKAGIQACVAINKKDDDRRGALRQAQKIVGEIVCTLNPKLFMAGTKRKQ